MTWSTAILSASLSSSVGGCVSVAAAFSSSTSTFVFLPLFAKVSDCASLELDRACRSPTAFVTVLVGAFFVVFVTADVVEAVALAFAARRAGAFKMFFRGDGGLSVAFARARVVGGIVAVSGKRGNQVEVFRATVVSATHVVMHLSM